MKNAKMLMPSLAVLLCVSLSCTFLKEKFSNFGTTDSGSVKVPSIPPFDPNGPLVSPGAYVIRILAKEEPALAVLSDQVEAAEQKLMKQAIYEYTPKTQTDNTNRTFTTLPLQGTKAIANSQTPPIAAHLMFQSGELSLPTAGDGALFGGFTGFLKGMLAGALNEGAFNKKETKSEPVDGGTSTMNAEIGVNPDGSSVFEIGIITETEKNGIKARTELKARIEGQDCPNAEGQVPITIKLRIAGQSGSARYEQDITAFVRVVVDDNADIVNTTIDVTQATARGRNGKNVFVETGFTYRRGAGQSEGTISNEREIRKSDNSTAADGDEAANSGIRVALGASNAAIGAAESAWQGGACIKIDANSPGTVEVNSSTSIPVKVIHKKEGTEPAARLESKLTGGASIDPALIPKTAGTLTYVAPGESGKTATIKLNASSKRGRATLDLTASTGGTGYRVEGKSGGASFKGEICSLDKPFIITVNSQTGSWPLNFTPNDEAGGQMEGSFHAGPCSVTGSGPYTVTVAGDGSGTIAWSYNTTSSCPVGSKKKTVTDQFPLIPAPDLTCP